MDCKAILFDAVGTLIYPEPDVISIYHRFGVQHGSCRTSSEIQDAFHDSYSHVFGSTANTQSDFETSESTELARWRQVVAEVFDDIDVEQSGLFREIWTHFADPQSWRLYDDVHQTWKELQSRQFVLGVISNFDARLRAICEQYTFLADCEQIFISSEIGYSKPGAMLFKKVTDLLRLKPSEILIVGDSLVHDIEGARAFGWQTCWLQRSPDSHQHEPRITSLTELL